MNEKNKSELNRAARGLVSQAARFVGVVGDFSANATAFGKSGARLVLELVRPIVPLWDAGAKVLDGAADYYAYAADRIAVLTSHVNVAADAVKGVHDRNGDPTHEEISAAFAEAQTELMPPPPVPTDLN